MREMDKGYRLSSIQRLTLRLLLGVERRGVTAPVPSTRLFEMVESNRSYSTYPGNFRKSCHTMASNGLINVYRNASLKMAFKLTEGGRLVAEEIEAEAQAAQEGQP